MQGKWLDGAHWFRLNMELLWESEGQSFVVSPSYNFHSKVQLPKNWVHDSTWLARLKLVNGKSHRIVLPGSISLGGRQFLGATSGELCFWQVFQGLLPIGLAFSAGHCGRCWWHLSTCVVVIEKLGTHSLFCFCQSWTCIEPLSTGWLFLVRTPSILSIYGTTPNRLLASRFHVVELCGSAQARVYHDILQERQCLVIWKTTFCIQVSLLPSWQTLATALGRRNVLRVFARAVDRVHGTVGCHQSRVGWGPPDGARDAGWWGWNIHGQWTSRNAQLKFWGT